MSGTPQDQPEPGTENPPVGEPQEEETVADDTDPEDEDGEDGEDGEDDGDDPEEDSTEAAQ